LPHTPLGEYNVNEKAFPISVGYGAGTTTFVFNSTNKCDTPFWPTMRDKSIVYTVATLEADNGDRLRSYPIDTGPAETFQKTSTSTRSRNISFYPVEISRRAGGPIGAVVHVASPRP
jgi:hypothetical protein